MRTSTLKAIIVFSIAIWLVSCNNLTTSGNDSSENDTAATYSVTYNANGGTSGSVPTDSAKYVNGATVTIKGNTGSLAKTGYGFSGWNTKADGLGVGYSANSTLKMGSADVTLYAYWLAGGTAFWAQTASVASNYSYFKTITVDGSGNIYAAGYQYGSGPVTYGTGVSASGAFATGNNAVIVKYDSSGNALWAKSVTVASNASMFLGLKTDASGNIYALGYQTGTSPVTYSGTATASGGYSSSANAVIVKYDSTGKALWAQSASVAPSFSTFYQAVVDSSGYVYVAGYQGTTGAFTYSTAGSAMASGNFAGTNAVLVKFDSSGNGVWAKTAVTAPNLSVFSRIAIDPSGYIYVSGYQNGNSAFIYPGPAAATATAPSSSTNNGVIVKFNSSGDALWAKTFTAETAPEASYFYGIAFDSAGFGYTAGMLNGTGTFTFSGGASATGASSGSNCFVMKFDPSSGDAQWLRTPSVAPNDSDFSGLAVDSSGNLYAIGTINGNGSYTFSTGVTAAAGYAAGSNSVIVKYDTTGAALWAKSVISASNLSSFQGVAADSSGNVYAAGIQYANGTYDYGNGVSAVGGYSGDYNAVIVKYLQ